MGLWDTMRNALGLQRPLQPRDPDAPLEIASSAQAWFEQCTDGDGIHLATREADWGRVVQVHEGPLQGPPPPALEPLPITASDTDLHHLRGLVLERRDQRWTVSVDLAVRARETPNPDGRMYLCDRTLSTGRSLYFSAETPAEQVPVLARVLLDLEGVDSLLIRANTLTVQRRSGHPWDGIDRGVDAALRQYFLRCGHAVSAEEVQRGDDPLMEEVYSVLAERVLPGIHADGGDLELVSIEQGVVRVAMHGACQGCPASTATLRIGVEQTLQKAFPGRIDRVESI